MRLIHAMLVAIACAIGPGLSHAASVNDMVAFYEQYAQINSLELRRCTAIFRQSLLSMTLKDVETRMRDAECFDKYSGFPNGPAVGKSVAPVSFVSVKLIDDVIVLRITAFQEKLLEQLTAALSDFSEAQLFAAKEVVVDLLWDQGGYVNVAQKVMQAFAPAEGVEFMRAVSRCGTFPVYSTTLSPGILGNKHYTILVNKDTASVAEWFVATMRYVWYKDSTRVVGVNASRTYGKTKLQNNHADTQLKVTCGYWQIPDVPIQDVGIKPDQVVKTGPGCGADVLCILDSVWTRGKTTTVGQR